MPLLHAAASRGSDLSGTSRPRSFRVRTVISFLLSTLFTFTLAVSVRAQDPGVSDDDVVRVRTDLVVVPAIVTDNRGRRVNGLTERDFVVRDDGRDMKIAYFAVGSRRVAMIFALDSSGSARDTITRQRDTAAALFARFGVSSQVAVIHFDETSHLIAPFSDSVEAAREGFEFRAVPNRGTAIFDAALAAIRSFDQQRSQPEARRILIIISDGLDNRSTVRPQNVVSEANARSVSIYTIQIPLFEPRAGRLVPRSAVKGFRDIADRTGGKSFRPGNADSALNRNATLDLTSIFKAIEDDLDGQYVLGYYPGEQATDGRFHKIEIGLTTKGKEKRAIRQLREGYQARVN